MKRGLEESYGLVKRPRPIAAQPELRLLIPSKGAGAVIGKGGDNIRRLRNDMHADIAVPDSSTPERVVNITTTMGNLPEILNEIILKVEEVAPRVNDSELRVLVHQSQAGAIIGRSGSKIKELREGTGTDVTVLSECCPMSTDRVIIIKGEIPKIINAVRQIMQICNEVPIKGMIRNYDATNYEPAFAEVYGGFIDKKMGRGRGGPGGPGGALGGPYGGRPGRGRAPGMRPPGFGASAYDDFDGYGYGAPPGRYMEPPMGAFDEGGEVTISQFTVPSDLAGTIIGKGGDRITRIREESGAKIVVNPPEGDSTERVITIKGTPGTIQAAKYLLQQCVKASPQGRRYIQLANN